MATSRDTPLLKLSFSKSAVDLLNAQKAGQSVKSIVHAKEQPVADDTAQERISRKRPRTPKAPPLQKDVRDTSETPESARPGSKTVRKRSKTADPVPGDQQPAVTKLKFPKTAAIAQRENRPTLKSSEPVKTSSKAITPKLKTPSSVINHLDPVREISETPDKVETLQKDGCRKSKTPVPIAQRIERPEDSNRISRKLSRQTHKRKLRKLGQHIADLMYDDWPKHKGGRHKGLPDCSDFWTNDGAWLVSSEQFHEQMKDLCHFASGIPSLEDLLGGNFVLEEKKQRKSRRRRKSVTPAIEDPVG